MKKTILVAMLCLVTAFCICAEELTTEQQKIYNSQALVVVRSTSDPDLNSKHWTPYQGANEITKAEFFRLAGYSDYEKLCLKQESTDKIVRTSGIVLSVACGVGLVAYTSYAVANSADHHSNSDIKTNSLIIGYLGAGALAGVILAFYEGSPKISTSFAMGVADIYNQELQASIKLNY